MGYKVYSSLSASSHVDQKVGYVSDTPKPYIKGNSYSKKLGNSNGTLENGQIVMPVNDNLLWTWWTSSCKPIAVERAVGKLKEKIYNDTTASLGIAVAQWDQTLGMAKKRLSMLDNFARRLPGAALVLLTGQYAARKRELTLLGRTLKVPSNSSDLRRLQKRSGDEWRKRIRSPGDLWLEFWFGWSASISDLQATARVLSDPAPLVRRVRGSHVSYFARRDNTLGANGTWLRTDSEIRVSAGASATVTVANPNAYLANRLGLVNLAAVAWDAIPFSWVVGWFGNFKQFLDQLTWDCGLEIPSSSKFIGSRMELKMTRTGQDRNSSGKLYRVNGNAVLYAKDRSKGWSGSVKLRFNPPTGNLTRCLSVASVLFQKLSKFSTPIEYRRA